MSDDEESGVSEAPNWGPRRVFPTIEADEKDDAGPPQVPVSAPPPLGPPPSPAVAIAEPVSTTTAPRHETPANLYDDEKPITVPTTTGDERIGILGGKFVGKSYLFQALVHLCSDSTSAGALTPFLHRRGAELFKASTHGAHHSLILRQFASTYRSWRRLPQTTMESQSWYQLRLALNAGVLGRDTSSVSIDFFDGSGDGFFELSLNDENRSIWRAAYADASVMVFCLPLWVLFARDDLSTAARAERESAFLGFDRVVANYNRLRREEGLTQPVRTILALTMADDRRSSLESLQRRWIDPIMDAPMRYARSLRHGKGIVRYLDNARRVSDWLYQRLDELQRRELRRIPGELSFGAGLPWLLPVSAIDGSRLDQIAARRDAKETTESVDDGEPAPVHVELPLLLMLAERHGALS